VLRRSQRDAPRARTRYLATVSQALPKQDPEATEPLPAWTRHVKLGGGAILWYYQPLSGDAKNSLSFFNVRLDVDVNVGAFGFHAEPRFRDSRLRPFFDGPAWIEEAYGSWALGSYALIKLGKIYSRLGLFWDNSFYGNVQVYDGLKLAPDYGTSIEGSIGDKLGVNYWVQFFLLDGGTNVSLANRDTISISGAHRRNEFVANLEPFYKFADDGSAGVGISLQGLDADLPSGKQAVLRWAARPPRGRLPVRGYTRKRHRECLAWTSLGRQRLLRGRCRVHAGGFHIALQREPRQLQRRARDGVDARSSSGVQGRRASHAVGRIGFLAATNA
jgi:hypothetical protein